MKKIILLSLMAMFYFPVFSQTIGEIELKDNGFSQKKFGNAPKKIFISQFRINYQITFDYTDVAHGGSQIGGGVRGDARARLALGITGISENDLKQITNDLYSWYLNRLKEEGYEILTADDAANTETLAGFERKTGGGLSAAQYPGFLMSIPEGFDYFVKSTTAKGKEKSTFTDNSSKLSADLGGAVVAKVNIVIPFVSDGESGGSRMLSDLSGAVAKVVMQTDLRLSNEIIMSGNFSSDVTSTQVQYAYASRRIAPDAVAQLYLKKPVAIDGVFEKKKYKAVETANFDYQGTNMGLYTKFSADDTYFENMQSIPCEGNVYKNGITDAGVKFLDATLTELFSNMK